MSADVRCVHPTPAGSVEVVEEAGNCHGSKKERREPILYLVHTWMACESCQLSTLLGLKPVGIYILAQNFLKYRAFKKIMLLSLDRPGAIAF